MKDKSWIEESLKEKPMERKKVRVGCSFNIWITTATCDVQTLAMLCSVFRAQPPADVYSLYGHRSSVFPPHHSRFHHVQLRQLGLLLQHLRLRHCGHLSTGRDCEQVNPWAESSPDDHRCGSQGPSDPREREREQHTT
ncbi:hypothetical protein NQZ68_038454 [Dissostichus eleginoides]|nr:hypothetical protein NQZ68_038454 [Dissostichus eleginoides]